MIEKRVEENFNFIQIYMRCMHIANNHGFDEPGLSFRFYGKMYSLDLTDIIFSWYEEFIDLIRLENNSIFI